MANPEACDRCGLEKGSEQHLTAGDCIRALRKAMLKQRAVGANLAFEVSVQYLGALEELSLHPEVGVAYRVLLDDPYRKDKESKEVLKPMVLPPERVAGVFAALLKKFKEAGDWTPLTDAQTEAAQYAYVAGRLTEELLDLAHGEALSPSCKAEVVLLIEELDAKQLVGRRPPRW